jgi:hypothetical protein
MTSKRRLRRKSCENKIKYNLRNAIKTKNRLLDSGETFITYYKCSFCKNYHIGHTNKKIRQYIRDRRANQIF